MAVTFLEIFTHMARISSECTFALSIFRIQELPTSNNPDEMRCMLDVGAIGTHKAATRARATANNIEKFLKSICFSFFSAGLPAAEVFLLFSFYNVRYASMHNKNKTKTHTHTHHHMLTPEVMYFCELWIQFGADLLLLKSTIQNLVQHGKQLNQAQSKNSMKF